MKKEKGLTIWHVLIFISFIIIANIVASMLGDLGFSLLSKYIQDSYTLYVVVITTAITVSIIIFIIMLIGIIENFITSYFLRVEPDLKRCPKCGDKNMGVNEQTNEWYGTLEVNDNLYTRKCRCGFEVTVDTNYGTTKKKIEKQICLALKEKDSIV